MMWINTKCNKCGNVSSMDVPPHMTKNQTYNAYCRNLKCDSVTQTVIGIIKSRKSYTYEK